jgi:hypothetical protein
LALILSLYLHLVHCACRQVAGQIVSPSLPLRLVHKCLWRRHLAKQHSAKLGLALATSPAVDPFGPNVPDSALPAMQVHTNRLGLRERTKCACAHSSMFFFKKAIFLFGSIP